MSPNIALPLACLLSTVLAGCGGGGGGHEQVASGAQAATPLSAAPPATAPEPVSTQDFLNWAETNYGNLFPGPQASQLWDVYEYRYYPATQNYLGVAEGQVYARGPATGGPLALLGSLADFTCRVAPDRCRAQLEFEVIASSLAIESAQTGVVRNDPAWAGLWSEGTRGQSPPPSLPAVDFSQQMVAGVSLGQRPSACYSVAVRSVIQSAGKITLEYQEYPPPPRAVCAAAVAYPTQVVRLARSDLPVEFVKVSSCTTSPANPTCSSP